MLGVGVDSYQAFWPEGAEAAWFDRGVMMSHVYEITEENGDLANHALFFWTARLPSAPLVHCWGGLALGLP